MSSLTGVLAGLSPLINQYLNKGSTNAANQGAAMGANALAGLTLPQLQQLLYTAQQSTAAPAYNAAQSAAAQQGANAYNNINLSPAAMQAQQQVLGQLQGIATNNGLTPQALSQLAQIRQQTNTNAAGQRGAILQQAQAQGIGNSGLAVAQEMLANQGNANTNALAGNEQQAAQQQLALQALQGAGNLGSSIYGQQYNIAANQAQAQNAINAYNTGLLQQSGLANQQATNTALNQAQAAQQATNLANQNAINTQYQTNAYNTLQQGQQQINRANDLTAAGQNIANQQNLQNKLNTATYTPMLNTLFGNGSGQSSSNNSGGGGLISNWLNSSPSSSGSSEDNFYDDLSADY